MFWQEDPKEQHFTLPEDVQDAVFNIHCKILPIDHAYLLCKALLEHLPWLDDVKAGIHDISVADGNGWQQDHESGFYYPSKRSKLSIRVPKERLTDTQLLIGKTLDLGEYQIQIVKAHAPKLLSDLNALFAKHVACDEKLSEEDFLKNSYNQLQALGITPKKMMAGLERSIKTPGGTIHTRALMVANLKKIESVTLQEKGIGNHRLLGCGLFIPQKGIDDITAT